MFGYSSFYWRGNHWRTLPYGASLLSPPCKANALSDLSVRKSFFHDHPECLYVRWDNNFDRIDEHTWWHIIRDSSTSTSLDSYSSNTRSKIRRGCKSFRCIPIERSELTQAYDIYSKSFDSYDTHEIKSTFGEFTLAIESFPKCSEFWGIFSVENNCLVGFSDHYVESNTCFVNSIWILPGALKRYAAYAFFYEIIRHYIDERGFHYVSDGARSISHDTRIHQFLIDKFRFRQAYSFLCVEYVCWLKLIVFVLYPFRNAFAMFDAVFFRRLCILLRMEHFRRLSKIH